jgi:hypothetical protein
MSQKIMTLNIWKGIYRRSVQKKSRLKIHYTLGNIKKTNFFLYLLKYNIVFNETFFNTLFLYIYLSMYLTIVLKTEQVYWLNRKKPEPTPSPVC